MNFGAGVFSPVRKGGSFNLEPQILVGMGRRFNPGLKIEFETNEKNEKVDFFGTVISFCL